MGRGIKLGSLKREARKTKFKAQDPASRKSVKEDLVHNAAPKGDGDIIDRIPSSFLLAEVPGWNKNPSGAALAIDQQASKKAARKAKKLRRVEQAKAERAMSAGLISHRSETPAEVKMKQLPGESKEDFRTRVELHMKTNLKSVSQKMATGRKSEKKKARADKRAQQKRHKVEQAEKDAELFKKAPRAAFNDVVERPPELPGGVNALKSRSQLKGVAGQSSASTAGSSEAGSAVALKGATDFSSYAGQVKNAYAALREKRLKENEQKKAAFSPAGQRGQKRRKEQKPSLSIGPSKKLREAIDKVKRSQEEDE